MTNNSFREIDAGIYIDFVNNFVKIELLAPISIEYVSDYDDLIEVRFWLEKHRIRHFFIKKQFRILKNYSSIKIDNITYIIPPAYDRKLLKSHNLKIWKNLFRKIFTNSIEIEMKKYKTLIKILRTKEKDAQSGNEDNKVVFVTEF